ncbi:efflux transporter outer membrane subunit [Lysobacter sp. M2-1]|uniref:efflux transporter outer membrane subunit n=1 Tax=Lysobacter sp. M2-1 TaxID=2916839 RepID=UPI001F57F36D|nr:efflux transporter outer membrane subunit [Lysobacter sp. M2-1]
MQAFVLRSAAGMASLILVLASCAAGPDYREPVPEAPLSWSAALPHNGSVAAINEWWRQFDDPLLGQLVATAEADSPSLAKAWANIEKARATLTSAEASGLPAVTAAGSASRSRQSAQSGTSAASNARSAGMDASWELDLFGKVRRSAEAAQARVDARVGDWHEARVSLAAEVADTYVKYRACALLAETYQSELTSILRTEKAIASLVEAGLRSPSEGALALAGSASTRSSLVLQRAQCDLLVKSLVSLTGIDESGLRELMAAPGTELPQPGALEVESVPAQVLRQRPDLASLERELAATSAEIGVAQADLYPSLSLSGSITVSASDLASSANSWSFGPSLSLPILDGGKRRAAVDSARASYTAALADYRQGVRNVVKEVEQALVNLDSAGRRADDATTAAREYRRNFEATEASWRAGRDSLLTLEEARRTALSAEIQQITLRGDRVAYWIALYKALGGGWLPGTPALPPETMARQRAPIED